MNQRQTGLSAVLWLARKEFSSIWISYFVTGGFMLVMGVLLAPSIRIGGLAPESEIDSTSAFLADVVMLLLATLLATTYTFWGALSDWRNSAERRLAMMRTLPIPVSTIVGSRMVLLLSALIVTVPVFFGPTYLLGNLRLGLGAYLAFVAFWIGYAVIMSSVMLYLEVVRGSKVVFISSFFSTAILIVFIGLVSGLLGVRIVYEVGELAINYGLIIAPAALIVGAVVFGLAGRMTARDLQYREIPA